MINLIFNEQELTSEEFNNLSLKEKHLYGEKGMGDRIRLTYHQALADCRRCIDSDEKLSRAFENFLEIQREEFGVPLEKEVFMGAFVDKFKARIFFAICDSIGISHYIYDKPSEQLIIYATNNGPLNNMLPDLSNIRNTYCGSIENQNFESIWRTSYLIHEISNEDSLNRNFSTNQKYVSDDHYSHILKFFKPLNDIRTLDDFNEKNSFLLGGKLKSNFNPAHSTIDPNDLINHQGAISTKNARSA